MNAPYPLRKTVSLCWFLYDELIPRLTIEYDPRNAEDLVLPLVEPFVPRLANNACISGCYSGAASWLPKPDALNRRLLLGWHAHTAQRECCTFPPTPILHHAEVPLEPNPSKSIFESLLKGVNQGQVSQIVHHRHMRPIHRALVASLGIFKGQNDLEEYMFERCTRSSFTALAELRMTTVVPAMFRDITSDSIRSWCSMKRLLIIR